ncbi:MULTISPECIES: hypothetical protein [unclassified Nostoc]|uniref:hypothetical protein n=1 Tax=unclassified Nostoc TaxID=2593658 RepID=UPI002AD58A7E|nr:hypothetical protein [Nostoc sp. DedQUE05]
MTSSWTASHPSLSKTGTRDDPNGANAAIAVRLIGTVSVSDTLFANVNKRR